MASTQPNQSMGQLYQEARQLLVFAQKASQLTLDAAILPVTEAERATLLSLLEGVSDVVKGIAEQRQEKLSQMPELNL